MDTQIIHNVVLEKDESLEIKKKYSLKQPNYFRIGTGKMNKHHIQSINLLDVMLNASSAGRQLIVAITDRMQYDHTTGEIAFVVKLQPGIGISEQQLKRGYKELNKLDLVRRVKRSHYMLNPNSIITDYPKQIELWNSLPTLKINKEDSKS